MEQNIQELTNLIYKEGIEKGEEEVKSLLENAKQEADKIIANAKLEAKAINEKAKKDAASLKQITESEIKLAGQKAILEIKQQIVDVVCAKALNSKVSDAMSAESIKVYIKSMIEKFKDFSGGLELLLSEKDKSTLDESFVAELSKIVSEGLEVKFSANIKGGFQIGPKDGGFKISLKDEDFNEFFKQYLRTKTRSFFFSQA